MNEQEAVNAMLRIRKSFGGPCGYGGVPTRFVQNRMADCRDVTAHMRAQTKRIKELEAELNSEGEVE